MANENKTYVYDAFISYRHTLPDRIIAEKLHKLLETYRPPGKVRKASVVSKVRRVFRDREELPTSSNLGADIERALEQSRYLIVICSPNTPLSQWVTREIVRFKELHGDRNILALLIEGEPHQSFPTPLRWTRKTITDVDGSQKEMEVEIEPLAADIRAADLKSSLKLLKVEKLRMLAPILGCSFDDLKQRHRERRLRNLALAGSALLAFFMIFGSISFYQLQEVKKQREIAVMNQMEAQKQKEIAITNETEARKQKELAVASEAETSKQRDIALANEAEANRQRETAEQNALEAKRQEAIAVKEKERAEQKEWEATVQKEIAVQQTLIAENRKKEAEDQRNIALYQRNEALRTQSLYLADLAKQQLEEGNTTMAMRLALEALPKNMEVLERPYVSEAELVLNEAVHQTDNSRSRIEFNKNLADIIISPDSNYLLSMTYSSYDGLALWDMKNGKCVYSFRNTPYTPLHAAFSPEGNKLAVAYWGGGVRILDAASGNEINVFAEKGDYDQVVYTLDGSRLAAITSEGEIHVWDTHNFQELCILKGNEKYSGKLLISPNGNMAVSPSEDNSVIHVWDIQSGTKYVELPAPKTNSFLFSRDGNMLIAASSDGKVRIFDTKRWELVQTIEAHEEAITHAALSPDGSKLVTASWDESAYIWDLKTGQQLSALRHEDKTYDVDPGEPQNPVTRIIRFISFSDDGKYIVTSSDAGTAIIWDAGTGEGIRVLPHTGKVVKAIFDHTGNRIATASYDHTIKIWEVTKPERNEYKLSYSNYILKASSGNIGIFTFGSRQENWSFVQEGLKLVELESGRELATLEYKDPVKSVVTSPSGDYAILLSDDDQMKLWNLESMEMIPLHQSSRTIKEITFSPDGEIIAYLEGENTVKVYSITAKTELQAFETDKVLRTEIRFSHDNQRLAVASLISAFGFSQDKDTWNVRMWDLENGIMLGRYQVEGLANDFAFSSETGSLLVSTYDNSAAHIVDLTHGQNIIDVDNTMGWGDVHALFSPDGRYGVVYTIRQEGAGGASAGEFVLRVFDLQDKKEIIHANAHVGYLEKVAFSADESILLTAGDDEKVIVWSTLTGKKIGEYTFKGGIENIQLSNQDNTLAILSSGINNHYGVSTLIMFTTTQGLIDYAREVLGDYSLTQEEKKQFFIE